MSRKRQKYNRHVVEATSIPLRDGGFTVHVDLERPTEHVDVTHFESGQRFATDEEALETGMKLGRQRVDGGYSTGTPVVNE